MCYDITSKWFDGVLLEDCYLVEANENQMDYDRAITMVARYGGNLTNYRSRVNTCPECGGEEYPHCCWTFRSED